MTSMELIQELERCAFGAWPAAETEELDGWVLRHTAGVTRRANSVWAVQAGHRLDLDARLDAAEAFYAARRLEPLFQLTPVVKPTDLDRALDARGYAVEAPVSILTRRLGVDAQAPLASVRVRSAYDRDWLHVAVTRGRFASAGAVLRALLDRIAAPRLFVTATRGEEPIAIGLGVVAPPWVGIFGMRTLPEHRRTGAGRAVLDTLCHAALAAGALDAYLQVERDNAVARGLYDSAGFAEAYRYHYRRKWPGARPAHLPDNW